MTKAFPLVLLPKRIVYVDDDGNMLDVLRRTMPKKVSRAFIGSPEAALHTLSQEAQYWRAIELLLAKSHEQRADEGEAKLYATSYFTDWRRFHLTGVLMVDYSMPGMSGVELVRRLEGFPARRILLTGEADAEVAVRAFNQGLIQKFIPKSTPDLYREITRSAHEMHLGVCANIGQLVRANLSQSQIDLLQDAAVVDGLQRKIEELDWMEYVVVGSPFGVLGMAQHGPLQWLQLETTESLRELSLVLADSGYPEADVRAASMGTAAPVNEIRRQLGLQDDRQLVPTDSLADMPQVCCALLDLPSKVVTARDYGVDDIRTPEELMRGLLRDVSVACQRSGIDGDSSVWTDLGLDEAIENLVATATRSPIHAQALTATIQSARLPAEVAARVQTQVSIAMISGKRNGNRK